MSYEKERLAFFDGSSSAYQQALKVSDTICGWKVTAIEFKKVKLAAGTREVALEVGSCLLREQAGDWILGGETRSYGPLAKDLKNSPRAVGQACGANPFPLVVPCHRVVAADGGFGGFARQGGGFLLDIKCWMLRHEGSLTG